MYTISKTFQNTFLRSNFYFKKQEYDKFNYRVHVTGRTKSMKKTLQKKKMSVEFLRNEGNTFFRNKNFFSAYDSYTSAISECSESDPNLLSILYSNLSATALELEKTTEAIEAASKAITLNPNNFKAYYRRGNAFVKSLSWLDAYNDYLSAAKLMPNAKLYRDKMAFARRKYKAQKYADAIVHFEEFPPKEEEHEKAENEEQKTTEVQKETENENENPQQNEQETKTEEEKQNENQETNETKENQEKEEKPVESTPPKKHVMIGKATKAVETPSDIEKEPETPASPPPPPLQRVVPRSASNIVFQPTVITPQEGFDYPTPESIKELMKKMFEDERPSENVVISMLKKGKEMHEKMQNIVNISVGKIHVVGDTHGQFQDVIHLFETYGYPSINNQYLFNGDFVDRGSMGVEIVISLLAWKLYDPSCIFLNRGNHESNQMNALYGFEKECVSKYGRTVFNEFSNFFNTLPLGHIINDKVLVVHGGLFSDQTVTIQALQKYNRISQPPECGPLNDILWSDPMESNGFAPSPRGVTSTFGPDVTEKFLDNNNLDLLIRSHQVQQQGYNVMHNGKCITIFSAPNYVGQMGNLGAIVNLKFDLDGSLVSKEFKQFSAEPIPEKYRPMRYSTFSFY